MKYVLIIATGRSGSTTLQRIINSDPTTMIYGETSGYLVSLLKTYENLTTLYKITFKNEYVLIDTYKNTYNNMMKNNIYNSYYNPININNTKLKIKELIELYFKTDENIDTLGCKEIAFQEDIYLLDLFIELFPDTKIILNIRNDIESQSKSKWFANDSLSQLKLKHMNNIYTEYYNTHKENTFLMPFEDIFNINRIQELFTFLGKELNQEEYKAILNNNLDY